MVPESQNTFLNEHPFSNPAKLLNKLLQSPDEGPLLLLGLLGLIFPRVTQEQSVAAAAEIIDRKQEFPRCFGPFGSAAAAGMLRLR